MSLIIAIVIIVLIFKFFDGISGDTSDTVMDIEREAKRRLSKLYGVKYHYTVRYASPGGRDCECWVDAPSSQSVASVFNSLGCTVVDIKRR